MQVFISNNLEILHFENYDSEKFTEIFRIFNDAEMKIENLIAIRFSIYAGAAINVPSNLKNNIKQKYIYKI